MRLFIAIELSQEVRDHLLQVAARVRANLDRASFTRPDHLHITLKFLGEVDDHRREQLVESLGMIRMDHPIELFADKLECFPDRGPVRIIAAGFSGDLAATAALHRAIEQRCQHLGFERQTRAYRPHVTLARARPVVPRGVRVVLAEKTQDVFPGPVMGVKQFSLISSILSPDGARYEVIEQFAFG